MTKIDYLKTEGRFDGVAFKPEEGWFFQTKNTGAWGLKIGLRVTDDVSEEGKCIHWVGWLSAKALPYTMKVVREVFNLTDLNQLYDGKVDLTDMPCSFTTENEDYNGKTQLKVKWLNPMGGKASSPGPKSDDVKAFIVSINAKAKALALDNGDDSVPF